MVNQPDESTAQTTPIPGHVYGVPGDLYGMRSVLHVGVGDDAWVSYQTFGSNWCEKLLRWHAWVAEVGAVDLKDKLKS